MSRFLGLDHGDARIGVALSDETHMIATSEGYIDADPYPKFVKKLKEMIKEKEVALIVVGLPRNMDGSYGPATDKVKEFVQHLKQSIVQPVVTIDERLSTVQASRGLSEMGFSAKKQKKLIDGAAAQIILQTYLDSQLPIE